MLRKMSTHLWFNGTTRAAAFSWEHLEQWTMNSTSPKFNQHFQHPTETADLCPSPDSSTQKRTRKSHITHPHHTYFTVLCHLLEICSGQRNLSFSGGSEVWFRLATTSSAPFQTFVPRVLVSISPVHEQQSSMGPRMYLNNSSRLSTRLHE